MPFKVHFYVALFLLNSYTILSTFGSQARNNLVPNKNSNSEYNSNNSNNNNSATVARRNSDVMDTGIMPNHSNNDFMFSHQAIKEQQDTAFMAVASIKMTKEFGQKNSTETERDEIDEAIIPEVAIISSPVPTIRGIIESITQPWSPSQFHGNKYFTNSEQHHDQQHQSNATSNHIDKTVPLTVTNGSGGDRSGDERNRVTSSTELVSTQIPQSIAISSATDGASERHKSQISTADAAPSNIHVSKKQLIISRVSTHSDTPPLAPSPKLNKIFDTLSAASKHHHHDHRYGPHFEDIPSVGNVTNITVQVGNAVYLNCRISLLQDKTVSWVRRRPGESGLDLLTVGLQTYSGDSRYKIEFQYPNNWKLKITSAIKDDEGTYECQISTYPPRVIQKNLFVIDPKVIIIDEEGVPVQDKFYEVDSTMQLSCIVRHVKMTSTAVYWSHGEQILNYDVDRGGVSVKTEILEKGANSSLLIAKINKLDSGNYTCSINASHSYTVSVHVLNGESFAELHHGNSSGRFATDFRIFKLILILMNAVVISYFTGNQR